MSQGRVLLHMYADGSVTLHHGGVEMGQGVHTKLAQLVASELDIPLDHVNVPVTHSQSLGQTFGTGGSVTVDRHGIAVMDACAKLKQNIAMIRQFAPHMGVPSEAPLSVIAGLALMFRIPLSVWGFQAPEVDAQVEKHHGFSYWTWAAALCEVEVDVLTGDYRLVRFDMVQDIGKSLNH